MHDSDFDLLDLNDTLIILESPSGYDFLFEILSSIDKDLGFLAFCDDRQIQNIIRWITVDPVDKKNRFRESLAKVEDYEAKLKKCPHALLPNIINEISGFSTNVLNGPGGYKIALQKVCDHFSVNYHPLLAADLLELELFKKIWDLGIDKLTEADIEQLAIDHTASINKYVDGILSKATYRVIIPCVLYIAYYRALFKKREEADKLYKLFD